MKNFKKKKDQQKPMSINVNPNELPDVACECGNITFIAGYRIKKVSALISPDGRGGYVNIGVSICAKCYTPLPANA